MGGNWTFSTPTLVDDQQKTVQLGRAKRHLGCLLAISSVLAFAEGALFVVLAAIPWIVWFAEAGFTFAFVLGFGALVKWYYEMENKKQAESLPGETGGATL